VNSWETFKQSWVHWSLIPFKVFVLLAIPVIPFCESNALPRLSWLDIGMDMFVGWLCLLCAGIFGVAAVIQRFTGPEGAARWNFWFAVLAFLMGAFLSPIFMR
jgi:hypothetical protein